MKRVVLAGPVVVGVIGLLAAAAAQGAPAADADNPEPGLQGQTMPGEAKVLARPYSKGVRVVGHLKVPGGMNATMAWADHCAYSPSEKGVTVIDVADPKAPKVVGLLTAKGTIGAGETLHASWSADRKILAASVYGISGPAFIPGMGGEENKKDAWLSVYDVSDCARPKLLLEYQWPEKVHTLWVSPNGRRIYGPVVAPFSGDGGLNVLDISDLKKPRFLGRLGVTRPDGTTYSFSPHEVSVSPDEKRIYAAALASTGGDLNKDRPIMPPNKAALGPDGGGIYILDNSDIAAGRPNPKLRLIGTAQHAGNHSAMQARIGGVRYLIGGSELTACPGTWPRLTNIADERNPRVVGEFRLAMNRQENCPPPGEMEKATAGVRGSDGTAALHWSDVDDPSDTHMGLIAMTWAGLRIADLRKPANPVEVAYFKPGDQCMAHTRYVKATGHIWLGCLESGFYVLALKPEVRAKLGLPRVRD
jgi:hypothetical protein